LDERRASPRQRRLNGAKIIFNDKSSVIDCIVRKGARLVVASIIGVPDQFVLRIDRDGVHHQSKVVCKSNDQIGVMFLNR